MNFCSLKHCMSVSPYRVMRNWYGVIDRKLDFPVGRSSPGGPIEMLLISRIAVLNPPEKQSDLVK